MNDTRELENKDALQKLVAQDLDELLSQLHLLDVKNLVKIRVHERCHNVNLGDLYAESGQTLQGSFSAVLTPIFASKYSLESSRRDLHSERLCTVLQAQFFV